MCKLRQEKSLHTLIFLPIIMESVNDEEEASHSGLAETNLEEDGVDSQLGEPAHHARRPMNAFLIFCKRHRGVVRDRYPHLENRSITKILGEWWANLEPPEKASYTELARQYKEAFLRANPDFKWYKLPAPPLRTLMTRPSNQNKPHKLECQLTCGPITPGKLADESQMGGLSSLLASLPSTPTSPTTPTTPTSPTVPKPPKKRYLQEALGLLDPATSQSQLPSDDQLNDFNNFPVFGSTSTSSTVDSECTSYSSDFTASTTKVSTTISYPSPFTKLRSHAATQLNSLQERKFNRRRSSVEANSKIREGKTTRDSNSKMKICIEEQSAKKKTSPCPKTVISETTIKASQQQIIDRVVDRLCGFSEQQSPTSPPTSPSPTSGSTKFPLPERCISSKSPPYNLPSEKPNLVLMSTAQATVTSERILPSIPLLSKLQTKKEPNKSTLLCIGRRKKVARTTSSNSAVIPGWSLCEENNFETKTINNNVYINKSEGLGHFGDAKIGEIACKRVECSANSSNFVTTQSSNVTNSNIENYSLSLVTTANIKNSGNIQDTVFSGICDNFNGTFDSNSSSNVEGPLPSSTAKDEPRIELNGSECCFDRHDMFQSEHKSMPLESVSNVIYKSDGSQCSMPSSNRDESAQSLPQPVCSTTSSVHNKSDRHSPNIPLNNTECYVLKQKESSTECIPSLKDEPGLTEMESVVTVIEYPKDDSLALKPVKCCSDSSNVSMPQPFLNKTDCEDNQENFFEMKSTVKCEHLDVTPKEFSSNTSASETSFNSDASCFQKGNVLQYPELHIQTDLGGRLYSADGEKSEEGHLVCPQTSTVFRHLKVEIETSDSNKLNFIPSWHSDNSIPDSNKSDTVQKKLSVVSPNTSNDNLSHALRPKTLFVTSTNTTTRTSKNSISEEDSPISYQNSLLSGSGEATRRKSLRACKGQRYREFMNEGRFAVGKRSRRNFGCNSEGSIDLSPTPSTPVPRRDRLDSGSSTTSEKTESVFSECSRDLELEQQSSRGKPLLELGPSSPRQSGSIKCSFRESPKPLWSSHERKSRKHSETSEESFSDSSPKKMFRAADFNLDEKIEALPSLSLEEFQLKKKAKKKRTSPVTKKSSGVMVYTMNTDACVGSSVLEAVPEEQDRLVQKSVLVGSQKRKARKQSITRLDTDKARARRDTAVVEPDVLNNIGLATLAEVASAKRKLTK